MHFHLPKPLHGWRAFVGEVGIIVVGVLLALGAEQIVETIHWHERVASGRGALRDDFANILANAREREREDPCIRGRLLELRNVLDAHPNSLPALGHIGAPPRRGWYPGSWDSLVASDVSTHLSRDELLQFANISAQARLAENTAELEVQDWAVIYTMVGRARPLASGEAAQLRKAFSDAAFQLNELRLIAPQIDRAVLQTNLLTKADMDNVREEVEKHLRGPNAQRICGPIMPPDPGRVDAPYDPAVQPNPLWNGEQSRKK